MLYHIGDKFLLDDKIVEVRYINNGKAWVYDTEELEIRCVGHCAILNNKGIDANGQKAKPMVNTECGAV